MNYHSLVQNKKARCKVLKSIYFHFKTATKQMLVFFDQKLWSLFFDIVVLDFIFISKFSTYYLFQLLIASFYSFQIFVVVSGNFVKLLIIVSIFMFILNISKIQSSFFQVLCLFSLCACAFVLNGMNTLYSQMVYTLTSSFLIRP